MQELSETAVKFYKKQLDDGEDIEGKPIKKAKFALSGTGRLKDTGNLQKSIKVAKITSSSIQIVVNVHYAKIHDEGAEIEVTERMRKYFFARYYETGREEYKNMALAKKLTFPERNFFGESDDLKNELVKVGESLLVKKVSESIKNLLKIN